VQLKKQYKNVKGIIMEKAVIENHERYLERSSYHKSFGYDVEEERKFILGKSYPLQGNILEVGTGKGHFTVALAKEGYKVTSIDISDEEQKYARLNIEYFGLEKQVDFHIENAEHLSYKEGSFDVILSINVLHHLENPFKVIDELIRVILFRGKIILGDFSEEGFEVIAKIHASEGRKHEVSETNLSDMSKYLSEKGFSIEKHRSKYQEILVAERPCK